MVHNMNCWGFPAVLFSSIFSSSVFSVSYFWVMGLRPPPCLRICWLFGLGFVFSSFWPLIMVVMEVPVRLWMAFSPP